MKCFRCNDGMMTILRERDSIEKTCYLCNGVREITLPFQDLHLGMEIEIQGSITKKWYPSIVIEITPEYFKHVVSRTEGRECIWTIRADSSDKYRIKGKS
jgi:hypothetical protein